MIRVYQTIFGNDPRNPGNCFQACVASLFDLPLEDVPHFVAEKNWWRFLEQWLLQFGLYPVNIEYKGFMPQGYTILNGKSPRGYAHSVIVKGGRIVHDPHPAGGGVEPEDYTVFVKIME